MREEGGREGGCSQPEFMSFLENTEPSNRQNSIPLPLADTAEKHQNRLILKITE